MSYQITEVFVSIQTLVSKKSLFFKTEGSELTIELYSGTNLSILEELSKINCFKFVIRKS